MEGREGKKERKEKVYKSLQAKGKAHGVVEQGVCQEQVELGSGNRTRLAVLVWGPRGGGAVQAMGVQRVCWPSKGTASDAVQRTLRI